MNVDSTIINDNLATLLVQSFFAKKKPDLDIFSCVPCKLYRSFLKNCKAFEHLESLVSGVGTSICLHILSLRHDRGCPADYTWWSSSLSSSLSSPLSASLSCFFCHKNELRTSSRRFVARWDLPSAEIFWAPVWSFSWSHAFLYLKVSLS